MSLFVRLVFCMKNGGIKVYYNFLILRKKFENLKLLLNNNELIKYIWFCINENGIFW